MINMNNNNNNNYNNANYVKTIRYLTLIKTHCYLLNINIMNTIKLMNELFLENYSLTCFFYQTSVQFAYTKMFSILKIMKKLPIENELEFVIINRQIS